MEKYVYQFSEGNASMRELLGGKGANLAEMTNVGLSVPQGFTITTEACHEYYQNKEELMNVLMEQVHIAMLQLEQDTGYRFGQVEKPLLVSIRSGAAASMPGMMDTILNLGLTDEIVEEMAKDNPRLAYDLYRRLIQMFGNVVKNIDMDGFDAIYEEHQDNLPKVVEGFKAYYEESVGYPFTQDVNEQLQGAIEAVFKSWNNERAQYYRKMNNITTLKGTGVNVQQMVFGNRNDNSATGVCFTRNPATGEKGLFGEMLWNAQGEDIVAGTHTPIKIESLREQRPELYDELIQNTTRLENYYKDMQDVEFTIDDGKLYILQTRNGKRTPQAALRIASDLVSEGLITPKDALRRISPDDVNAALHTQFKPEAVQAAEKLAKGLPASPGAATGKIAYTKEKVVEFVGAGDIAILVRNETSPEDIEGMHLAEGILTAKGGMTSHAAVVTRSMGKPCIVGCDGVTLKEDGTVNIGDRTYREGDYISIDGSVGEVYDGRLEFSEKEINEDVKQVLKWADETPGLTVMANGDTPKDAQVAKDFDAKGIGLIRTEHMFFEHDRIQAVREMILSDSVEERRVALDKILPYQRGDFEEIFKVMRELPMTIRYLDPPLHEFLPTKKEDIEELATRLNASVDHVEEKIESLHEFNPMMGHRGCRLAITYPEIPAMQTRAIIEAAVNVQKEDPSVKLDVNIMIPLVGELKEYVIIRDLVKATADSIIATSGVEVNYHIGTMIELPRACVLADKIAKEAEFMSFGTNDLTQMTYGFSRDDTHSFIHAYIEKDIISQDPFVTLDTEGVGALVKMAVEKARSTNPKIKIGVCGEHGGDPASINFFKSLDIDYVSCSPYRVPVAIVASRYLD